MSNTGVPGNTIGGSMTYHYYYDDLYRLDSASGDFIGDNDKKARYSLSMSYDKLHNITRKKQDIVQNGIKFGGILNAGYDLSYVYAGNSQQIANIAEQSYRVERSSQSAYQTGIQAGDAVNSKTQSYTYDANGNMTYVATGKLQEDSTLQATSTRQMLWDEENRLLAVSDNGFVSNYFYDASGERTVKLSGESEGVFVNGVQSAGRTSTDKFTAYISPYLVVNNGGYYSKHIYMGSQRITSKLGSSDIFHDSINPVAPANPKNVAMSAKLTTLTGKIQERYDSLGVTYRGTSNGSAGLITSQAGRISVPELYFYHPDHLGSSSLITDNNGTLVQHIQYVPFGEVFVEETKSSWSTPYKFNAKELDDETGLYYYGARYYDPRTSVWLSVDPLAEKYPNVGSYVYCLNNPVRYIDPTGMEVGDPLENMEVRRNQASNLFGMVRVKPDGTLRPHQGIDYYAKEGTTALSIKSGVVYDVKSEKEGGDYGLQVIIEFKDDDGNTLYAVYAHGSMALVKKGQKVKENDPVMKTGTSGNAKGMKGKDQHLHFEIRNKPNVGKGLSNREDPNKSVDTKFHSADPNHKPQKDIKTIKENKKE